MHMKLVDEQNFREIIRDRLSEQEMNQVELAEEFGVDPGTISRNLSGATETPYSRYYQIWRILEQRKEQSQEPASSLMTDNIEWVDADDIREVAAEKMTQNDFSQLPVRSGDKAIGWVTDFDLMEHPDSQTVVGDMVGRSMITVHPTDSRELVKSILEEGYPAVLVEEDGYLSGIITKFDLL